MTAGGAGTGAAGAAADDPRPLIAVACGVLRRPGGEVLLAQRPAGKIAAGYWEFPGGKIEPGEAAAAALARELHEELGIMVRSARPLIRFRHAYRNRIVILDTWLVEGFEPEPQARENQALAWIAPEQAGSYRTLPTVAPGLAALGFPVDYVFTPPAAGEALLFDGLARLPRGALLRLRLPALDEPAYAALARRLQPQALALGLRLVLDRAPGLTRELGAWAQHAPAAMWRGWSRRPDGLPRLIGSAHSRADLLRLRALGADAAVLGHVAATGSHPQQAPMGWAGFAAAAQEIGLPVYAIGGLGPGDQAQAFRHGAQGTAGIAAYWSRAGG